MTRIMFSLLAIVTAVGTLTAQAVDPSRVPDRYDRPAWTQQWSPLIPFGQLARRLPSAPGQLGLLLYPDPPVGLFWTAANPAALAFEIAAARTEFMASLAHESGDFRRPLDPKRTTERGVSALSWMPLGDRAGVIGQVVFDERLFDDTRADQLDPHGSAPFVVSDTGASDLRSTKARLEAAGGWRLGSWALGVSGGLEAVTLRTRRDPVPTVDRAARPGATIGVARRFGLGDLVVGVHGRWQRDVETLAMGNAPFGGIVHRFEGFTEPTVTDLAPSNPPFSRRIERHSLAGGAGLAVTMLGMRWVAFGQRTRYRDEQSRDTRSPVLDKWRATGIGLGGAVQRAIADRALVTLNVRWRDVDGQARKPDLRGNLFVADEQAWSANLETRIHRLRGGWSLATEISFRREKRRRRDVIAEVLTDIRSSNFGVNLEVARKFSNLLGVSASYTRSFYTAEGTIPKPTVLGPLFQELIAPELGLYLTDTQPEAARFSVQWKSNPTTALVVQARYQSFAPSDNSLSRLSFAPGGDRNGWRVRFGVILQ
ncbi:MAG: DUF6850 family outer membrane beta-barrel protein [Gemmatimonadales bacterium]